MKIMRTVLIVIVILVVGLLLARNEIIRRSARKAIQTTTGFDIEMGRVHAGLFSPDFEITDTRLINPEDFPERLAMQIKTLKVGYYPGSLLSDRVHLKEVVIDIPRAILVVREDGETNLGRLGKAAEKSEEEPDEPEKKEEKKESKKQLLVDVLTLRIGTLEMHTYEEGNPEPKVEKYEVDFDRTARNVDSFDVVNGMITAAVIEGVGSRAIQGLSQAWNESDGDLDKFGDSLEKQAKDLKKSFKSMFGGKQDPDKN